MTTSRSLHLILGSDEYVKLRSKKTFNVFLLINIFGHRQYYPALLDVYDSCLRKGSDARSIAPLEHGD